MYYIKLFIFALILIHYNIGLLISQNVLESVYKPYKEIKCIIPNKSIDVKVKNYAVLGPDENIPVCSLYKVKEDTIQYIDSSNNVIEFRNYNFNSSSTLKKESSYSFRPIIGVVFEKNLISYYFPNISLSVSRTFCDSAVLLDKKYRFTNIYGHEPIYLFQNKRIERELNPQNLPPPKKNYFYSPNGNYFTKKRWGKYGFLDSLTQKLTRIQFNDIYHLKEGRIAVKRKHRIGFIDMKGNKIIDNIYDEASVKEFNDGIAAVSLEGKWGYIDTLGKTVIPFIFKLATNFSNGRAFVMLPGKKYFHVINMYGDIISDKSFYLPSSFQDNHAILKTNDGYGLMDNFCNVISDYYYDEIEYFVKDKSYKIKKYGHVGILNYNGEYLVPLFKYDYIGDLIEGFAVVQQDSLFGYIDSNGKEIIEPGYTYIDDFNEGLSLVCKNNKFGYIDTTGEIAIPLDFDDAFPCCNGIVMVKKNNKFGYYFRDGSLLSKIQYDSAQCFHNYDTTCVTIDEACYFLTRENELILNDCQNYLSCFKPKETLFYKGWVKSNLSYEQEHSLQQQSLIDYIIVNIENNYNCRTPYNKGSQLILSFILDELGSISNEKIEKGINPIADEDVLSALKDIPDYKPIYYKDIPIIAKYVFSFIFR